MADLIVPSSWRDRLDFLAGRRRELLMIVAIVVGAVVGGMFLWGRGAPAAVAPPARSPQQVASPHPSVSTVPLASAILVHVAGAVRRPGLYELPAGARVADAIEAARGPRVKADLNALNLAEALTDGQKLDVPAVGESASATAGATYATPAPAPSPGASPIGAININTADQVALETIPGVGPVTALAIIDYRTQIGSFTSIDQLLDVSGIGPATLESIRPYVTI